MDNDQTRDGENEPMELPELTDDDITAALQRIADDVATSVVGALQGEREPLQSFGIVLDVSTFPRWLRGAHRAHRRIERGVEWLGSWVARREAAHLRDTGQAARLLTHVVDRSRYEL